MSIYHWCVGNGSVKHSAKISRIARKHGAEFTDLGDSFYFSAPNLGYPFDKRRELEVMAALSEAGLTDAEGRLLRSK
jgi:hypothetical protein